MLEIGIIVTRNLSEKYEELLLELVFELKRDLIFYIIDLESTNLENITFSGVKVDIEGANHGIYELPNNIFNLSAEKRKYKMNKLRKLNAVDGIILYNSHNRLDQVSVFDILKLSSKTRKYLTKIEKRVDEYNSENLYLKRKLVDELDIITPSGNLLYTDVKRKMIRKIVKVNCFLEDNNASNDTIKDVSRDVVHFLRRFYPGTIMFTINFAITVNNELLIMTVGGYDQFDIRNTLLKIVSFIHMKGRESFEMG
ncbi:hypothetical protein RI065_10765 [Mycoplasmatota bacterium zrk1]